METQAGLFESQPLVLVRDPEGGVVYTPRWIAADEARRWFETLRDTVPWRHERRQMYDREVDVPRLMASWRLTDPDLPAPVLEAAQRAAQAAGAAFTSVGLNYYRDGNDSVAEHNDKLDELVPGQPIALLSLGTTRRMTIRAKAPPRRAQHVDLEPGSLLVMSWASQLSHLHGIPKAPQAGPRISLAFRVRPPGARDG